MKNLLKCFASFVVLMLLSVTMFAQQQVSVQSETTILKYSYPLQTHMYVGTLAKTFIVTTATTANETFAYLLANNQVSQFNPDYYVNYTVITIPAANLLDSLHMVNGDTLIAAPGSGKFIKLISITAEITVNSSGAWGVGVQTGIIGWGPGTAYKYAIPNADLENASGTILSDPIPVVCKPVVNSPVIFKLSGGTKPTNTYKPTIKLLIHYQIVTL